MFHRKLAASAAALLTAAVAPALASAGAGHFTDSWTNEETSFFQPNACVGVQSTGHGLESGSVRVVHTPNGGEHAVGEIHGSIPLYEALGPGPWDPRPGAYIGTWTYDGTFSEQDGPDGQGTADGTSHGPFVFADGHTAMLHDEFHLTFSKDGPPKLFFAHFTCGGA